MLSSCRTARIKHIFANKNSVIFSIAKDDYNDWLFLGKKNSKIVGSSVWIYQKVRLKKEITIGNEGYIEAIQKNDSKLFGVQNTLTDMRFFSIDLLDNYKLNYIDTFEFDGSRPSVTILSDNELTSLNLFFLEADSIVKINITENGELHKSKVLFLAKNSIKTLTAIDSTNFLVANYDYMSFDVTLHACFNDNLKTLQSFKSGIFCEEPFFKMKIIDNEVFILIGDCDMKKTEIWKYSLENGTLVCSKFDYFIFDFIEYSKRTYFLTIDENIKEFPNGTLSTSVKVKKLNFKW